ncbi:MAG: hypothetical protein JO063_08040 [Pseudonocardiales bacterium]|nr:hypothetical protein [Pseudonocardiales bacterium]MBW0010051.1 hypothetical protein [Pseudonocardiales bacterium]
MAAAMDVARQVADAVLYEGYLLYPYRASARKNQIRWQWGVLVPPAYAAAGHGEHATSHTECLLEPGTDPVLHIRLRFLQLQHRSGGDGAVPEFDEAVEHEIDSVLSVSELLDTERVVAVTVPGGTETTDGLTRQRWPLTGEVRVSALRLEGPYGVLQLTVKVVNTARWEDPQAPRHLALRHSLIAAHTVLAVTDGEFISLIDPPEWAKPAVECCRNERTWPVMVGEVGRRDMILVSPIILYDYPVIAPESPGDLFDGTEIDEILTLRTMTLTDEEKAEARATDERARKLMDRVDSMPPEMLDKLHGAIRYLGETPGTRGEPDPIQTIATPGTPWWDPGADASVDPETDSVLIAGVEVAKGSRVLLTPGLRRTDAQDMFLAGRTATVAAVLLDVDGNTHVAVTLDDDPGAEISAAHGRFRYFSPDELAPLGAQ